MRVNSATRTNGRRRLLLVASLALVMGLAGVSTVAGSSGDPSAVAAKKQCKKSRWKCAPKTYDLSASGTFTGSRGSQVWSAEVELGKRRASPGIVDYAQNGGKVTVSATSRGFEDHCTLPAEATFTVPQQTLQVPRGGINDADFGLSFHLRVNGVGKNEYGLGVGAVQPELSNIKGTGTVTCPEGTTHAEEFAYINTIHTAIALVEPGKVGSSPLKASAQAVGESVSWKLTKGK